MQPPPNFQAAAPARHPRKGPSIFFSLFTLWSAATCRRSPKFDATLQTAAKVADDQSADAGFPAGQHGWGACMVSALQNLTSCRGFQLLFLGLLHASAQSFHIFFAQDFPGLGKHLAFLFLNMVFDVLLENCKFCGPLFLVFT